MGILPMVFHGRDARATLLMLGVWRSGISSFASNRDKLKSKELRGRRLTERNWSLSNPRGTSRPHLKYYNSNLLSNPRLIYKTLIVLKLDWRYEVMNRFATAYDGDIPSYGNMLSQILPQDA